MAQLNRNLARRWNPIRVAKDSGDVRLHKKIISRKTHRDQNQVTLPGTLGIRITIH